MGPLVTKTWQKFWFAIFPIGDLSPGGGVFIRQTAGQTVSNRVVCREMLSEMMLALTVSADVSGKRKGEGIARHTGRGVTIRLACNCNVSVISGSIACITPGRG